MLKRLIISLIILSSLAGYRALANVYASNIRVTQVDSDAPFDGDFSDLTGARIWFTLNDSAGVVKVKIIDVSTGSAVKTIVLKDLEMGEHSVVWDGTDDNGNPVSTGNYVVVVEPHQFGGYSQWTMYYEDPTFQKNLNIYTRGVDINRDPKSRDFGFIYVGNSGGPIGNGIARYRADGTPAGDDGKPLILSTKDILGSNNVFFATIDYLGRVYVSRTKSGDGVYRYDPRDGSLKKVVNYIGHPKGLAAVGTGADFKLYIANGENGEILLARLGTDDTLTVPLDTIAKLGTYVNDLVVINDSVMYVNLKSGTGTFGSGPGWTEKYIIKNKTLPLTRSDTVWSISWGSTASMAGIVYYDVQQFTDIVKLPGNYYSGGQLFVSIRDDNAQINGVWRIYDLDAARPSKEKIFDPPEGKISSAADLTVDVVGNIIFFENSKEFIYFISPPTGHNFSAVQGIDTIKVTKTGKAAPVLTLAEARKDEDNDFKPDLLGDTVIVFGVVISPNYTASAGHSSYYIYDGTAGMNIFLNGTVLNFNLGDYLRVIGKVAQFKGLTEVTPLSADTTHIKVIDTGRKVPTPKRLTISEYLANAELYEGQLIRLDSLWLVGGAWPSPGSNANLEFASFDFGDTVVVRIDLDTDIDDSAEVQYPVTVVGVAGQFTSSEPPNDGYQVLPRFYTDFTTVNLPPGPFALERPADGDTIQIGREDSVIFSWTASEDGNVPGDPIEYILLASVDTTFSAQSIVHRDTLPDTFIVARYADFDFTEVDTISFFWSIRATDGKVQVKPTNRFFAVTIINKEAVKVEDIAGDLPIDYYLAQNYPNPFNPSTTIEFGLPKDGHVQIIVFNILGQKVETLVDEFKRAGRYKVVFNARNRYASGVYFYTMIVGDRILKRKMMLLK
jgi:hypothetical protein